MNYNENLNIVSIIDQDIPYYFINKIDDMNNIIGQQQLESITQLINIQDIVVFIVEKATKQELIWKNTSIYVN